MMIDKTVHFILLVFLYYCYVPLLILCIKIIKMIFVLAYLIFTPFENIFWPLWLKVANLGKVAALKSIFFHYLVSGSKPNCLSLSYLSSLNMSLPFCLIVTKLNLNSGCHKRKQLLIFSTPELKAQVSFSDRL